MVIIGIDPGVATTGYGLIKAEKNKVELIDYGCITTQANTDHPARLEKIALELEKIIKTYQPTKAAVEELFFSNNVKTALKVGEARGVILMTLIKNKVPVLEFTPLQVKQAITSYGRADKKQMQSMVKIILNLKEIPKPDDAADALAVAITCSNL